MNKRIGLVLVLLMLLTAACGSGASQPQDMNLTGENPAPEVPAADEAARGAGEDGGATTGGGGDLVAQLVDDREIIKTGQISIEVPDVAVAAAEVRTMTTALGGYIGSSQAGTLDERTTLTLRVPADAFEETLSRLRELEGTLQTESTSEEDVSAIAIDLEARLKNLRASEAQYRTLLERATDIEDVLAVQTRLDGVRGEIEQYQAQLDNLNRQTDMATLTVALSPEPSPATAEVDEWNPGRTVNEALSSLLEVGQSLANGAIWFVIVWLPILLVLAIITIVALRGLLGARRRLVPPTQE